MERGAPYHHAMNDSIVRLMVPFSRQELALIGVTFLWGATFLIIHTALRHCGPLFFVGLRFTSAGAISLLMARSVMRGLTLRELAAGLTIGVAIFLAFGLQSYGLQTIN